MKKNLITDPRGPSSAQESSRYCTARDMRHAGQEDRSRVVGAWTSEVGNAGRCTCLAEQQSQEWVWGPQLRMARRLKCFTDGVKFQHSFILKAFLFLFDDGMQLQA